VRSGYHGRIHDHTGDIHDGRRGVQDMTGGENWAGQVDEV